MLLTSDSLARSPMTLSYRESSSNQPCFSTSTKVVRLGGGLVLMIEHLRRASLHGAPASTIRSRGIRVFRVADLRRMFRAGAARPLLSALLPRVTPRLAESCRQADGKARLSGFTVGIYSWSATPGRPSYQPIVSSGSSSSASPDRSDARGALMPWQRGGAAATDGHAEEAIAVYLSACNWDAAATLVATGATRARPGVADAATWTNAFRSGT
jgi:hypothetical protein